MTVQRFMPDSSCMVPLISPWHEHHARACAALEARVTLGESMVVAAPALIETYSVVTRLPRSVRVTPSNALGLIRLSFLAHAEVVALPAQTYLDLLTRCEHAGIAGGAVFDVVIASCALQARVDTLVTFNERHFRPLLGQDVQILVP